MLCGLRNFTWLWWSRVTSGWERIQTLKDGCSPCSNISLFSVPIPPFHLTSCASGRGLRGLRRRCWGRVPSFSPDPSPSPEGPSPSAGLTWSPGRGLRGKNRRRKRRLLGAYRLPLTGTPPGPVTLAASEPCETPKKGIRSLKQQT